MYVSETDSVLVQYDLQATNITASKTIIASASSDEGIAALQIGPDSIIYAARIDRMYISSISNPDAAGATCNFVNSAIRLCKHPTKVATSRFCNLGLPGKVVGYRQLLGFDYEHFCFGDSTRFYFQANYIDSVKWDFGDPQSGLHNESHLFNPKHLYKKSGQYLVKLEVYQFGIKKEMQRQVQIDSMGISVWADTLWHCQGDSAMLVVQGTSALDNVSWSNGKKNDTIFVQNAGMYQVNATIDGCQVDAATEVFFHPIPEINLGNDTTLCTQDSLRISVDIPIDSCWWSDGNTDSSRVVFEAGIYFVTVKLNGCIGVGSIQVYKTPCSSDLEMPNIFTPNDDGTNDFFVPVISENIRYIEVQIFNRWGSLVAELEGSYGEPISWDGRDREGRQLSDGVYYWVAEYADYQKKTFFQKGTVTLMR